VPAHAQLGRIERAGESPEQVQRADDLVSQPHRQGLHCPEPGVGRGGGKAERADHEEDTGWAPIERATPMPLARGRNGWQITAAGPLSQSQAGQTGVRPDGRPGSQPGPRIDYEPATGLT
jgi:hypothetical protein